MKTPDFNDIHRTNGPDAAREAFDASWANGGTAEELAASATPKWEPAPKPAGAAHKINKALVVACAADIKPEPVTWLWPGRVAAGKQTIIGGDPGLGKSQCAIDIAATITVGGSWPCGEGRAPLGDVLMFCAEDDAADTIVPRLMAAGADLARVHIVRAVVREDGNGNRSFNLKDDLDLLEQELAKRPNTRLVIMDPISSYMGKADSHNNTEVRGVLEPISELAARTRAAFLTVTHLSKGDAKKALHRFIGSIAFVGAARAAFLVAPDEEDESRRLFLHAKNNLAVPPKGLAFRLGQREVVAGVIGSQILWDSEPVTTTADQALNAGLASDGRSAKDEAIEFLNMILAAGPAEVLEIERQAREAGLLGEKQPISQCKPIRAARNALGIKPYQEGRQWLWALPGNGQMPSDASDALFRRGHLSPSRGI